ncbi:tRNA (uridine(34)/cytosine(34)/5-carboxymethylaminomethyluridine(34)-2'-O)-methyltransferase TrmL [Gammaproteobacteria bacterium AH-315-C21]|nr:tRNA (uridine(34)/cytosine(34)/5-carboxymethylaminomethyluridine(34)-2'-O)-methyltransferase TrmL [Gammaproteobacteria bacterium]MBN4078560.1 tRNA (uridine(34)/cytosine(34)/5-carboxymethylaminomethyluridine(34)-2'-O)-methyltransferase TrmL [Gammaproteobacteria bacterium AH-315-C21]
MFNIVLFEPEIPPNTGNIIRLCANSGASLHLIKPLGFELDNKRVRRAGLDYHQLACVSQHESFDAFISTVKPKRLIACSTKGKSHHAEYQFEADDALLFGPETRGLPNAILQSAQISEIIRIPMKKESRSLNLSNAVAIILYEAWRQHGFL